MMIANKHIIAVLLLVSAFSVQARKFTKDDIKVVKIPSLHEGRVVLKSIKNLYDTTVYVSFVNEYDGNNINESLNKNEEKKWDLTFNVIKARPANSSIEIEILRCSTPNVKKEKGKETKDKTESEIKKESKANDNKKAEIGIPKDKEPKDTTHIPTRVKETVKVKTVISDFNAFIDSIPFLTKESFATDSAFIAKHLETLQLSSIDKIAYINDKKLYKYVVSQQDTIRYFKENNKKIINDFLLRYGDKSVESGDNCIDSMLSILGAKVTRRDSLLTPLKVLVEENVKKTPLTGWDWKFFGVCGFAVLICVLLVAWYIRTQKKQQLQYKKGTIVTNNNNNDANPSLIVVGQKTQATLKKQSLDDVYDNEGYYKIDCDDFCGDSAVRTMYIKNVCIKEIYNMYAEDLRNPENPKEDGCMVLGRWVHDEVKNRYDVSLECIVMPGDDAVFAEYELNFGGKIKLKMSEKLRKLRRETGLQYDLTCWVHSHPGLGVFFSNSDNNVHMQLKNPVHPGFLTAMVIDILTPKQETGIFTIKQDGIVNSKNELKKTYSLEEMYQWALSSERKSFDANDYFDALGQIKFHNNECFGIQLSNGAIIDMSFLSSKQNGFIGFVHGFTIIRGEKTQCIISTVTSNENAPDNEMLGCFIIASHCSTPSIRKAVTKYLRDIKFVLVYTATDGLLTSIPVVGQDLCSNDVFYGEQKLEDLKIWTRRRR